MQTPSTPQQNNLLIILILGALSTVSPFAIDMYLPAFPELANDLHTTVSKVSLSVSSYFVGFALGQIIYGPLLDRFGRKPPLAAGLSIFILTSIGCMFAESIEALIIFRFFQALGGCAAMVSATAMVRDFFPVEESAKVLSLMVLILGVSPLLAPTVGGFVVTAFGWQVVFAMLAVIVGLILFIMLTFLPEPHKADKTVSLKPGPIFQNFKTILRDRQFSTFAVAGSLSFSGLFVYVAGSPAIFMDMYKVSANVYGAVFAALSVGFIGGSQLNVLLSRKFSSQKVFKTALCVQACVVSLFLIFTLNDWCGLYGTVAFLFFFLSCVGISYPNAAAVALAPFEKNAGSASSLIGFLQIGLGALASTAVGLVNMPGSLPMVATMTVTVFAGLVIVLLGSRAQA